ncbi:hypothetical protein QL285_007826 [Trifolium repens]|nr:hypothetical protein QL285_007824 [Trifolium repens]KAK2448568.1 hypothetical protein QL285_007825 [Trifolium repens]KAK2448569.1 hypothetical protein QL285_007826 [Trifolium repens]
MLQVPNYTLKHPKIKSDPVMVAERSHGEQKSDKKTASGENQRAGRYWSLLVAQPATPVHENQHYGLDSKSTQNSIFHAITHKAIKFKHT